MAPSVCVSSFLLLLTVGLPAVEAAAVMVIVGDPFIFPSSTCDRGQSGSLKLNLGDDEPRPVADFASGEWKPVEDYKDRIKENSSTIIFTQTRYTDGRGIYELTCGQTEPQLLQLQVVFALDVSVTQGEAALLPCYFNNKPSSFSWIRDRTVLCELKSGSEVCRADRRLSVSKDWSHGNLSLILDRVQPEDQGVYYCFIQDGPSNNQSGSPAAVRLRVRDKTRTTPSPEQKTQTEPWIIIIITAIVILLVVAPCFFLLGWCLHARSSTVPSETRAGGPSSQVDVEMALCSIPAA